MSNVTALITSIITSAGTTKANIVPFSTDIQQLQSGRDKNQQNQISTVGTQLGISSPCKALNSFCSTLTYYFAATTLFNSVYLQEEVASFILDSILLVS